MLTIGDRVVVKPYDRNHAGKTGTIKRFSLSSKERETCDLQFDDGTTGRTYTQCVELLIPTSPIA